MTSCKSCCIIWWYDINVWRGSTALTLINQRKRLTEPSKGYAVSWSWCTIGIIRSIPCIAPVLHSDVRSPLVSRPNSHNGIYTHYVGHRNRTSQSRTKIMVKCDKNRKYIRNASVCSASSSRRLHFSSCKLNKQDWQYCALLIRIQERCM